VITLTFHEAETASPAIAPFRLLYHIRVDSLNVEYGEVERNQNLSEILAPDISYTLIDRIARNTRHIFDVRRIRSGNRYAFLRSRDTDAKTLYFIYEINDTEFVVYDFRDSLKVTRGTKQVTKTIASASGTIRTSLWNTFTDRGLDINLALKLADVYAWTIDFYELQPNDRFKVLYERLSIDSSEIGVGKILAGEFETGHEKIYAFYYIQDSAGSYFNEQAQSLQRTFLKAPLRFSRITSRFSHSRKHPILKIYRPHHGIDYSAPRGTPVVALGDGRITEAGWNGGFGRYVRIRHNSVYSTGYGHLSGYGPGIRPGKYVKQGDVIGYIGSSGLSTGPHLDFRVYKNSYPVDPLKMESPPAEPVKPANLSRYKELVTGWIRQLDTISP